MAIPDHVKAKADAVVEASGHEKFPVKDMNIPEAADWNDRAAMEAARAQQRDSALQQRDVNPTEPDKE